MRRCLNCDNHFPSSSLRCENCGNEVVVVGDVERHVDVSQKGGFDQMFFKELVKLEPNNFWFRARNDLIDYLIASYARSTHKYLEIGCGTGYVLERVERCLENAKLSASEYFAEGLFHAKKRVPRATFLQVDGRRIPFYQEFDLIGLFDVLEHIDDDERALSQIYDALLPLGKLILTVPQYQWLWTVADDYAHHQRRYSNVELLTKLKAAGFEVRFNSSFVTSLFPALLSSRLFGSKQKLKNYNPKKEFMIPRWLNAMFYRLLSLEVLLIKRGLNFSFGGSRVIVATKPASKT